MIEQQLADLTRDGAIEGEVSDTKLQIVAEWYKAHFQVDLTQFPSWPVIEELRLVANTAKHAEGQSADQLRRIRPEIFHSPIIRNDPNWPPFHDARFCDDFQNVEQRAEDRYDWLAKYMLEAGTWNTPIVLFENPGTAFPSDENLNSPYHLLEGHRRLAFLNGLKRLGRALPKHWVWIARLAQ